MISLERYRQLLREPDVSGAVAASVLGRLPIGMAVISILLFVQQASGSFAQAGTASALYVVGIGAVSPFVGRLIDRIGPRPILAVTALAYPLALIGLVVAVRSDAGPVWVGALAMLAGASLPPVAPCIRALLKRLLRDDAHLQTAYSLDSVIVESIFIIGPAVVSLLAAAGLTVGAVLGAAAAGSLGALLFGRSRAVRAWRGNHPATTRTLLGPLRSPGLVPVLVVTLCYSTAFGLFEVAATAVAARAGAPAAAGLILAVTSIGSASAALAYGSRTWPLETLGQYRVALAAMAVGLAVLSPLHDLYVFAAVSILAGAPMSTVIASQSVLIARIAPRTALAESFTWSSTCLLGGVSAGIALGGFLLERWTPDATLRVAALATLLGLVLALTWVRGAAPAVSSGSEA